MQRFTFPLHHQCWIDDHTHFVGEVLEATLNFGEKPLAYHDGKYWGMTSTLDKPASEFLEKIKALFEEYVK